MNFKGTEVNVLYTNPLWKLKKPNLLINKSKKKISSQNSRKNLQKQLPFNQKPIQRSFAYSFFKHEGKNDKECLNLKTFAAKNNNFYNNNLFLFRLNTLLTLHFYRNLLIKYKKNDKRKMRLKYSKILAKKARIRRFRNRCKKQIIKNHYGFFSGKKHSLYFKENYFNLRRSL